MSEQTRVAIQGFHDALNNHDMGALTRLVHKECVFETTEPPDGTRHVGRDAVLAACKEFFDQSPEARFEMEEILQSMTARWSGGAMTGEAGMCVALM